MNTLLPYPEYDLSAFCLDRARLGKQRLECLQMCRVIERGPYSCEACRTRHSGFCERCACGGKVKRTPYWAHPAVQMWIGCVPALAQFGLECCREWKARGYNDTMTEPLSGFRGTGALEYPWWHGDYHLHLSWQSRLIQKDPVYYRRLFGDVPGNIPQVWPTKN